MEKIRRLSQWAAQSLDITVDWVISVFGDFFAISLLCPAGQGEISAEDPGVDFEVGVLIAMGKTSIR